MAEYDNLVGMVIGYGSVGRHHARALVSFLPEMAIVEVNEEARWQAQQAHPSAAIATRLENLDVQGFPWEKTVAVIASWGPSHADLFHQLADFGVRRIVCEKPMASSVAQAQGMKIRAEVEAIALSIHHFIRNSRFVPALRQFANKNQLGEPVMVVVQGGAAGLVINGLHWIDFATDLFGSPPLDVTSTAHGDPINPRSRDLKLYGGSAVWRFCENREAIISFNNASSIGLSARVYFRNAVVQTDSDISRVTIYARDPEAVERFPAITRTGLASELLFEGQLPGMQSFHDGLANMLRDAARGEVSAADPSVGVGAVSACIGMLLSSRECRAIQLPIESDSEWGREIWPIS